MSAPVRSFQAVFQALLPPVWIGLCTVALSAQTTLLFRATPVSGWSAGFVFGGAAFGYYFTHPDRLRRYAARALGVVAAVCFWRMSLPERWTALVPLLIWAAYYGFRRPGASGLRTRPMLKPLAIALAWAWITVLLPLEMLRWPAAWALFAGRTAFIFALALAYDLVDREYDLRMRLDTLALRRGERATLGLIDGALLCSAGCAAWNFTAKNYGMPTTVALLVSLAMSAWLVRRALRRPAEPAARKRLIDGLMLLQYGLCWVADRFG